jgi:hypothetical protein
MRSVSQSLNLATTALGQFAIIPLILLVNSDPNNEWVPNNLDDGHLSYYFYILSVVMLITIFYFNYISSTYDYKTTAEMKIFDESCGEDESNETPLITDDDE